MCILSRYIVRHYLTWMALALTAFVAIFLVVDLTDRLNDFLDRAFEGRAILNYYVFYIPYILILTLPMASLLACLFAVGDLSRRGELTAMKAAGLSLGRILAPLVWAAFALGLVAVLVADRAVPGANRRRAEIERGGAQEVPAFTVRENLVLRDVGGQILSIGRYDVGTKTGYTVSLDRYEKVTGPESRLRVRVTAESMQWDGRGWEWREGVRREFEGDREVSVSFASLRPDGLTLRPEDLERPDRKPDEMSYAELRRTIDRRRLNGMPVRKEEVELRLKVIFPFAALVMTLFGAPLASSLRRAGRGTTFGLCLLLSFIYYGSIKGCQALGWNGLLSPALSAWLPNVVFACVGVVIFLRAHK
ncbi:MAG: YjgP/YjgQ family permease [Candidatus Latescibacteria bacterium]|nr:YjgP/YjgQ family permease [Candidatus Latescibacterota bacterium]